MGPSEVRQPRLTVLANGAPMTGVLEAAVQSNAYLGANRFEIRAAYAPAATPVWAEPPILIEIQVSLDGASCSLITGHADSLELDPIRGEATVHGRDLTALLVGAQTGETFENNTASGIATLLAGRHGLTPNVAATGALVGRLYQNSRTRTALSQHARITSEWDVLTWLADQEGYDVWVDGTTLNFQPRGIAAAIATVTPACCCSFRMKRSLDLAGGMAVLVESWNSQTQQVISQSAASSSGTAAMTLTAVRPNLTSADATTLAQQALAQLTAHEFEITFDMPGDLIMMPRCTVTIAETGTIFDGTFEIVEVDRRVSFARGFTQSITARGMPWTAS